MGNRIWSWVPFAVWALVVWAGLYLIFWLEQSDCTAVATQCIKSGLRNLLADVVMLSWVYHYQTLIGGILAIVAASTILVSASIERRYRRQDALAQDASVTRSLLASLRQQWFVLKLQLKRNAELPKILEEVRRIEALAERVPTSEVSLRTKMIGLANLFRSAIDLDVDSKSSDRQNLIAFAACAFLDDWPRLFDGDTVKLSRVTLTPEQIEEVRKLNLNPGRSSFVSEIIEPWDES